MSPRVRTFPHPAGVFAGLGPHDGVRGSGKAVRCAQRRWINVVRTSQCFLSAPQRN